MTSVHRSLFSNSKRSKFLTHLTEGVTNILINLLGLSDLDNYHEFCHLMVSLKFNYHLGKLIALPCYPEAIIVSIAYVKSVDPLLLDAYTPEVAKAYIKSCVDPVTILMIHSTRQYLSFLGSFLYGTTTTRAKTRAYFNMLKYVNSHAMDISIHELQLDWLVLLAGQL
uniref:Uncharacterized protein n=1 Tax=Glossina brevipalpis TaxID=37001 RepID=A0A1A9WWQ4_9MUSC